MYLDLYSCNNFQYFQSFIVFFVLFTNAFTSDPPDRVRPLQRQQKRQVIENTPIHQGYAYQYAVTDAHSGTSFDKIEQNDGYSTSGQYRVLLPDGRIQIVNYHTDDIDGYTAQVVYQGNITHHASQPVVQPPKPIHRDSFDNHVSLKGEPDLIT